MLLWGWISSGEKIGPVAALTVEGQCLGSPALSESSMCGLSGCALLAQGTGHGHLVFEIYRLPINPGLLCLSLSSLYDFTGGTGKADQKTMPSVG